MSLLMLLSVILLSMLTILFSTLCVIRNLICMQELELASKVESDLQDTVDWDRKCLADFNVRKTQLVSFDWCNNTGAIDVKVDRSVLEEKSSFKMLELTFSAKLDWGSYITSIAKAAPKNRSTNSFDQISFS